MICKNFWKNRTITTKIGLVISIGIIISILAIVIGAVTFLKQEYLTAFGKQQFTTVQAFALYIDADLASKLKAITVVAGVTPPEVLADSSSAQKFLANRTGILSLFDDGLMLLSADGGLLAEMPFISAERVGKDLSSSPFFQQADKAARPIISEPFSSIKPNQHPIIEMMAPVRDASGKISGYLCGGMTLNGDNALGNIAKRPVGESGYFYVYSQDRAILVHRDTTRMMQKDVPPGANRLFDRALQGFDGSGENVTSKGLRTMSSFQHLKAAPWILAANLPMKEVLAPFYSTQRLILLTLTISGLGALLLCWWALLRFTAPLHRFANRMKDCCATGVPLEDANGPELNFVITKFNQLLEKMKASQDSIRKLSMAVEQSPVSIVITNTEGAIEFVNPAFTQHTGYTFEEAIGKNPRFLKTEKNPPETYASLWQTISNGRVWEGEFYNMKKNGEEFIEHATISPIFNDSGQITHYMAIKEDITAKKQSEEIIWKQANFDHLTGLPNRRLFLYRLKNALPFTQRDHSSLALLFLDLDHFKEVNDTLGHDQGDVLLVEVARRLLTCVRDTDTVARFGGDEFILLLTNIKLDVGIDKVTKKILESLKRPYSLNNHEVTCISASIGVTTCPEDADDISSLLKNADMAMYLAKASGRNCWRSYADVCEADRQKEEERHVEI